MSSLIVEVVRIKNLDKHPNADTLIITNIKGWQCIVKENQFQVGDLAVYIPPDAVIPSDMIEKHKLSYLKGERVKTLKLRGVLSEGLLLSVPKDKNWKEGDLVATELGIVKWEPPTFLMQPTYGKSTSKLRPNPFFKRYSEVENIKNYPKTFKDGEEVVISEKVHGTNFRAGWVKKNTIPWWTKLVPKFILNRFFDLEWEWCVGSRNVHLVGNRKNAYYDRNIYHEIANRYNLKSIIPKGWVIFGEIYGAGIQDLSYGLKDSFDVTFFELMRHGLYFSVEEAEDFIKASGLPMVPCLYKGPYKKEIVENLYSQPSKMCDNKHMMEGCVIRSLKETSEYNLGRKILKAINPDYLLRKGGTEFH